ncbi:hypothetical protein [Sansalvadorimonas verongulae]|uniref:hypothetical protein n=1 Tax=Sansalvadorimonas verongulae TaxID=2172824 RepID=UPI0012BC1893|nr:hypothetical protein [Sansalvadorimonas verongulae]MTI14188.1 hypothetical protein [Sansalvadorimonas verongulae]
MAFSSSVNPPKPLLMGGRKLCSSVEDPLGPKVTYGSAGMSCKAIECHTRFLLGRLGRHVNIANIAARACASMSFLPRWLIAHMSRDCVNDLTRQSLEGSRVSEGVLTSCLSSKDDMGPEQAHLLYEQVRKNDGENKRRDAFWRAVRANYTGRDKDALEQDLKAFLQRCHLSSDQQLIVRQMAAALAQGTFDSEKERLIDLYKKTKDSDGHDTLHNVVHVLWNLHLTETLLEFGAKYGPDSGIELKPPYISVHGGIHENPDSEIIAAKNRQDYYLAAKLKVAYNYQELCKKDPDFASKKPIPYKMAFFQHYDSDRSLDQARKDFFEYLMQEGEGITHAMMFSTDTCNKTTHRMIHWPFDPHDEAGCLSWGESAVLGVRRIARASGKRRQELRLRQLTLGRRPLHEKVEEEQLKTPASYTQRLSWGAVKAALCAGSCLQDGVDPWSAGLGIGVNLLGASLFSDDTRIASSEKALEFLAGSVAWWSGCPIIPIMGGAALSLSMLRAGFGNTWIGNKVYESQLVKAIDENAEIVQAVSTISTALMVLPPTSTHWQVLHGAFGAGMALATFIELMSSNQMFRRTVLVGLVAAGIAAGTLTGTGYAVSELLLQAGEWAITPAGLFVLNNLVGVLFQKRVLGPIPRKRAYVQEENEERRKEYLSGVLHNKRLAPAISTSLFEAGLSGVSTPSEDDSVSLASDPVCEESDEENEDLDDSLDDLRDDMDADEYES